MRLTNRPWKLTGKLNAISDDYPGGGASPGLLPGQVGTVKYFSAAEAAALSNTSLATLREAPYGYVQSKSGSTASPARGLLAFFATAADEAAGIVTPDGGATVEGRVAGVYVYACDKGDYTVIQMGRIADVQFKNGISDGTDGNIVLVDTTTNKANAIADGTAGGVDTGGEAKRVIGNAVGTVTDNAINPVLLRLGW